MAITLELRTDQPPWPNPQVDPYIRLAVALLETEGHRDSLLGMKCDELELLMKLKPNGEVPDDVYVPAAYKDTSYVTGTLDLTGVSAGTSLRKLVAELRDRVARLKLAVRKQPRLEDSLRDIGLPVSPSWKAGKTDLDGKGVIVGIIDDGCALAHRNFLKKKDGNPPTLESRIFYLWDQTDRPQPTEKWKRPPGFDYGWVLEKQDIDSTLERHVTADNVIREEVIYEELEYGAVELGSHGTHVMDIAAGNGESSGGYPGVAPGADIIFVQIPKTAIGNPADSVLSSHILDGLTYIFSRAAEAGKPAVVNISYGGYGGPHDGTSLLEEGMDDLLNAKPGRAVVVSAGNSFAADCHAAGTIAPKQDSSTLHWIVGEEDPTLNLMEIWYSKESRLKLKLTPPDAASHLEIPLDSYHSIRKENGSIVGWVFHRDGDSGNGDRHILIALRPTHKGETGERVEPAPAGSWQVQLYNEGSDPAGFHAWIERDDAGSRKAGVRLQSRFAPGDASPECTLGSLATGHLAISVGAYNTATQEVCGYSACGPTRDKRDKPKPDVCAPAEEDAEGLGILSAAALSGQPGRMNGTSAAAPHVAGLIALMFQAANGQGKTLPAGTIRELLVYSAVKSSLMPSSRWPENGDYLAGCIGGGKINATATLHAIDATATARGAVNTAVTPRAV